MTMENFFIILAGTQLPWPLLIEQRSLDEKNNFIRYDAIFCCAETFITLSIRCATTSISFKAEHPTFHEILMVFIVFFRFWEWMNLILRDEQVQWMWVWGGHKGHRIASSLRVRWHMKSIFQFVLFHFSLLLQFLWFGFVRSAGVANRLNQFVGFFFFLRFFDLFVVTTPSATWFTLLDYHTRKLTRMVGTLKFASSSVFLHHPSVRMSLLLYWKEFEILQDFF